MTTASVPEVQRRGRATVADLEALHGLVCDVLLTAVRQMQETGKPHARLLAVAAAFLKINGIEEPQENAPKMAELLDAMPDFDSDKGPPRTAA